MITRFFRSYLEGLRHEMHIMTLQFKKLLKKRPKLFEGVKCKISFVNVTYLHPMFFILEYSCRNCFNKVQIL
jgi:hypothetical protein